MLREMDALLRCLPQYPAQNSLRSVPPKERARALLYHIKRQESRYRSRPANEGGFTPCLSRFTASSLSRSSDSVMSYDQWKMQDYPAEFTGLSSSLGWMTGFEFHRTLAIINQIQHFRVQMAAKWSR
jgi:hypothetical protein